MLNDATNAAQTDDDAVEATDVRGQVIALDPHPARRPFETRRRISEVPVEDLVAELQRRGLTVVVSVSGVAA